MPDAPKNRGDYQHSHDEDVRYGSDDAILEDASEGMHLDAVHDGDCTPTQVLDDDREELALSISVEDANAEEYNITVDGVRDEVHPALKMKRKHVM